MIVWSADGMVVVAAVVAVVAVVGVELELERFLVSV
jgi:hypothetical protein